MQNSDALNQLVTSMGAITELLGIFYNSLLTQGFTETQALGLTTTFLQTTLATTLTQPPME